MRILVTGGAGFIGVRLVEALRHDHDLTVMDNLHPQVHGEGAADPIIPGADFVRGDVTSAADWDRVLAALTPNAILHLAAETGTGQSLTQSTRHGMVNVVGTTQMLDALARHRVVPGRIVLTSSRAVYGEGYWSASDGTVFPGLPRTMRALESGCWNPSGPRGESGAVGIANSASITEPRPTNIYAATKLAQEHILEAWATSMGSTLAILRLQNVYGAGQAVGNPYTGVLTHFASTLVAGGTVDVYEGGDIVRDFVHVSDVVAALVSAVRVEMTGVVRADIGCGAPQSLIHAARTLQRVAGLGGITISEQFRRGDVRSAFADNTKAEEWLGFTPKVAFEDGARELVGWVGRSVASHNESLEGADR